jgi:hypothetical protein
MRKALAMCSVLILGSCDTGSNLSGKPGENAAFNDYISCRHKAAHDLDDYRSDASIIGVKVAERCTQEFHVIIGGEAGAVAMYNDKVESREVATATTVVLDELRTSGARASGAP